MRTLVTLVLLLAWAPSAAWAACAGSDIAGTYQIFAWSHATNNVLWTRCTLKVRPNGALRTSTNCDQRDVVGNKRSGNVQGGSLSVKSSCKVTGNIRLFGEKNTIVEAWMTRDTEIIEGVGKTGNGNIFQFTAVRR